MRFKANFLRRGPIVLPHVTLAQRVIDNVVKNALSYDTETGETLVGFSIKVENSIEPDLFVLDTIPPDESAIRQGAYFEQGDDTQGDIFAWWADSWEQFRTVNRGGKLESRWDIPLSNLGDWHKHPGTLTEPSWGDSDTAWEDIRDDVRGRPQILAILATVWDRSRAESVEKPASEAPPDDTLPQPIKVPVDENTIIRLDCWYMSRHTPGFVPLTPKVVTDLPELPLIAWHLRDPKRARQEVDALMAAGYTVSLELHDADGVPPLEICLQLAKRTSTQALILVTQPDFPDSKPQIRTTPLSAIRDIPKDSDLFLGLWKASQSVEESALPAWSPDRTLADFVKEFEEKSEAKAS